METNTDLSSNRGKVIVESASNGHVALRQGSILDPETEAAVYIPPDQINETVSAILRTAGISNEEFKSYLDAHRHTETETNGV